jgi:N6-adenosine-specific RNA methylase IME4
VADARRITQWAPEVADAMRRGVVPTMHVARAVAAMPADARRVALAEIERLGPRDVTVSAVKRAAAAYLQSAAPPSPQPPVGRYPVVYADPPWRYEDGTTSPNRFIENHYPTMALEDICALPVAEWAAPDAVLFLWATSPKLEEALQVMRAWGFQYRSHAVWAKDTMGMGYLFRQQHELLLVGRRGAMPAPQPAARVSSLIHAPRREHSAKPDKVYDLIDAMYPSLRKVELFARHQRGGLWTSWGNEDLVA